MRQNRILLFVVVLSCALGLILPGCDKNPLPDWEDPWPTGNEAPVLSAVAPDSGKAGASVTLSGTGMHATTEGNFVLVGAGTGLYLCPATDASAAGTAITVTIHSSAANLPFNEWTVLDTVMGVFAAYPDSDVVIDTIRNVADTADSLYDTTVTVYEEGPDTVSLDFPLTSPFIFKMSARGSELWSNTIPFKVVPSDTLEWRTLYPDSVLVLEPDTLVWVSAGDTVRVPTPVVLPTPVGWTVIE